jgi:hypothetical protein
MILSKISVSSDTIIICKKNKNHHFIFLPGLGTGCAAGV